MVAAMWLVFTACQEPAPDPQVEPVDTVVEDSWVEPSWCGDEVIDEGEECDDGNAVGGDGCTPICTAEATLEEEPNDSPAEANAWSETVYGYLAEDDVDCFGFTVDDCQSLSIAMVGECPIPATLQLHDPAGIGVAAGSPDATGCAVLDPAEVPGARFAEAGEWAVCAEGLQGREVPFYALDVTLIPRDEAEYVIAESDDPDGDGLPDRCDDDDDGDGVLDVDDNCPSVPNGPDMEPLSPDASGFIRTWLAAGPFAGRSSESGCLPSAEAIVGEPAADPTLGEAAGDLVWRVWTTDEAWMNFLPAFGSVGAPREVYVAVYLRSDEERELTLGHGPDDGATVWLDDEIVQEITGCQGAAADKFPATVNLPAGWSKLLIKVYDQGGGWGDYVRFLDAEGAAVTDLELSLTPYASWENDQVDSDGDGIGDVCDETP